MFSSDLL